MSYNIKTFAGMTKAPGTVEVGYNNGFALNKEVFIMVKSGQREAYLVLDEQKAIAVRDHLNELIEGPVEEEKTDEIWESLQMDTLRDHTEALNAHAEALNRYVDLLEKQKRERDEFNRLGVV